MYRFKWNGFSAYASVAVFLLIFAAWPPTADSRRLRCVPVTKDAIAKLFVKWNEALEKSTPKKPDDVVNLYAPDAVLLPTVKNGPLTNHDAIRDYFVHFLEDKPSGAINESIIWIGCNVAFDAGLYTFTYTPPPPRPPKDPTKARYTYVYKYDGARWLIVQHHSSVRPVKE